MKTTSFILLGVGCLSAFGQTNSARVPDQWLSLPQGQLREVISEDESIVEDPTAQGKESGVPSTTLAPESSNVGDGADSSFTLEQADATKREMDAALYRRLKAQGCFTPKQPAADNYFVRSVNTMFDQEEMHVGKTTVTCSIITAIKKKNPLCLINPILLNISW